MSIRPSIIGGQSIQSVQESVRALESQMRKLQESINCLKRGESISSAPAIIRPSSTVDASGGGGGLWGSNSNLTISVNNGYPVSNLNAINFTSSGGTTLSSSVNKARGSVNIDVSSGGGSSGVDVSTSGVLQVSSATNLNFNTDETLSITAAADGSTANISVVNSDARKVWDYAQWGEQAFDTSYAPLNIMPINLTVISGDELYWYEIQLSVTSSDSSWNFYSYIDCTTTGGFTGATYTWGGHSPEGQIDNGSAGEVNVNGLPSNKTVNVIIKGLAKPSSTGNMYLYLKSSHDAVINCATVVVKKLTII